MVAQAKAVVSVVADTKQFGRKVEGEVKGVNRAIGGMSTAIKGIGVLISAVLASRFVQALGACIEKAIELERNVRAVKQSLEHTGQAGMVNLQKLRNEFKETAKEYTAKGGSAAIAEMYRRMATGAYNAAEAEKELGTVAQANMIWQGRYGDTVDYCNRMLAAFDLQAETTEELLSKSAVACDRGQTSWDEIAKAAGRYTPAIKANNIQLDEFLAIMSVMTGKGEAGRAVISALGDVALDMRDSMEDAGMSYHGLMDAVEQLREKKMTAEEWKEFAPEVEERLNIQLFVNSYDEIIQRVNDLREAQSLLGAETAEHMMSAEYSWEHVKAKIGEVKETIGDKLKGAVLEVADVWGETLGGIETRYQRIKRVAEEILEMQPEWTGVPFKTVAEYGETPEGLKQLVEDLRKRGYRDQDILLMQPEAEPYLTLPREEREPRAKPAKVAGAPRELTDEEKAARRLGMTLEQYRVFMAGPLAAPERAYPTGAGTIGVIRARAELEAAREGRLITEGLEAESQAAIENMASLFGSAGAEALWGDGEEVAKQLGMTLAMTALSTLGTKAVMKMLAGIPGIGGFLNFIGLGGGGVIKAAQGVTVLPPRPGGWMFPFADKWINAAEKGQSEMLAVLPFNRAGRELLMRDVLPAFFPEITHTTSFRPTVNAEVKLTGLDPYHVTAAVHVDQGQANRARIQRKAA